jgi:hypothetical protein
MGITFPTNTVQIIDDIRLAVGRPLDFIVVVSSYGCSVCHLDPITNKSDDSFCTVCSGNFWIEELGTVTISAVHITFGPIDLQSWQGGGSLFEGQASAQLKYTDENVVLVDTAKYVVADGKRMEIKSKILRGVKPLNRMILSLQESEKEG